MSLLPGTTTRWRDAFNPLRGLTMSRAVALREAYDRGEMADVQWTFRSMERSDADLLALVERRVGAVLEMDWTVKARPPRLAANGRQSDRALAAEQQAALASVYERIDNLYEAIGHLSLAVFRGFAHLEKQSAGGGSGGLAAAAPASLGIVDQWNVVRNGARGAWKYNPEAKSVGWSGLPSAALLDPERFVILEHPRPIDFFALPKFVRMALGEKDWTAFTEIYGIPGGVVILPPSTPRGREAEYAEAAERISEGASGVLPHGSEYRSSEGPRGANPFRGFLDYLTEKLVLVGTGGLLTMLSQSGSGTLAGSAHAEAFRTLARSHARRISEAFQQHLDEPFLRAQFPGRPVLAYFELNFQAENDAGQVVDHAVKLAQARYRMSAGALSERTGYELVDEQAAAAGPGATAGELAPPERAGGGELTTKSTKDTKWKQ